MSGETGSNKKTLSELIIEPTNQLFDAKPEEVQKIAASQIKILNNYYVTVLDQAKQSFKWALIAAGIGLCFYLLAVSLYVLKDFQKIEIITLISGSIIEMISGINFYLYKKTTEQLSDFHQKLYLTQKILLANSICESLEGEFKQNSRANLIKIIMEIDSKNSSSDKVAPCTPKSSIN